MDLRQLSDRAARFRPINGAPSWSLRITNAAKGERAKVYVYDVVGGWDLTADDFVQQLHALDATGIDLHINSPGGYVFDGVAIYSALKNHKASVTTYVDGLAASAASFIAMAGDEIVVEKPARMMIHDAQGIGLGNAADMREYADLLDETSDVIAGIYADRAGGKPADWRAAMLANNRSGTWYTAHAAVDAGLADRVGNDTTAPEDRASQLIRARARVLQRG
jgi:ATP-dependent protease ClpP protease subunit